MHHLNRNHSRLITSITLSSVLTALPVAAQTFPERTSDAASSSGLNEQSEANEVSPSVEATEPETDDSASIQEEPTPRPSPEPAASTSTSTSTTQPPGSSVASSGEIAPVKPAWPTISGSPGQGITLTVNDAFSINIRSRLQLRYQFNVSAPDEMEERTTQQLVNIGTARLWISGNILNPDLTYMIQLALAGRDYRDGATSPIYDGYLQWEGHRDFNLRVGQYFVPFDRLRTVREWALQMADRPRPVLEFTLDRDVGVTVYSENFLGDRSPLAWYVGAFGGGGTNLSLGRDPGALVTSRLEFRPLGPMDDDREGDLERAPHPRLAVGGGFAANFNTNRLRSTTGPTFSGGTTDYLHAAADFVFKWRGWAVQAEYLWKNASADQINSIDDDGADLIEYTRSGQGWIVQSSYTFPHPIEIVGRLSGLYAFSGTDPRLIAEADALGQEVAAGLNYYINGHKLKLQGDWIARMPHDFAFKEAEHVVHAQLDVTF